jgi:hypothetical protein
MSKQRKEIRIMNRRFFLKCTALSGLGFGLAKNLFAENPLNNANGYLPQDTDLQRNWNR